MVKSHGFTRNKSHYSDSLSASKEVVMVSEDFGWRPAQCTGGNNGTYGISPWKKTPIYIYLGKL